VQAPLPRHLAKENIFSAIAPEKDVDGFNPYNFGLMAQEQCCAFIPCTPKGILRLLRAYDIPTVGRHAVVVGRSLIVGRPMALLLQSRSVNATVTVCHSQSSGLKNFTRSADIVICAAGQPRLIDADSIREGATVIDVGQNTSQAGQGKFRLCGDVDFDSVFPRCGHITPVPGGVGPMTVAMLLENTVDAFSRKFCV
jgi:methylenetetrahydrofolate dehydrogenase (NADP+)/methenyltetrahydrofolate cyclohydrolase